MARSAQVMQTQSDREHASQMLQQPRWRCFTDQQQSAPGMWRTLAQLDQCRAFAKVHQHRPVLTQGVKLGAFEQAEPSGMSKLLPQIHAGLRLARHIEQQPLRGRVDRLSGDHAAPLWPSCIAARQVQKDCAQ